MPRALFRKKGEANFESEALGWNLGLGPPPKCWASVCLFCAFSLFTTMSEPESYQDLGCALCWEKSLHLKASCAGSPRTSTIVRKTIHPCNTGTATLVHCAQLEKNWECSLFPTERIHERIVKRNRKKFIFVIFPKWNGLQSIKISERVTEQ